MKYHGTTCGALSRLAMVVALPMVLFDAAFCADGRIPESAVGVHLSADVDLSPRNRPPVPEAVTIPNVADSPRASLLFAPPVPDLTHATRSPLAPGGTSQVSLSAPPRANADADAREDWLTDPGLSPPVLRVGIGASVSLKAPGGERPFAPSQPLILSPLPLGPVAVPLGYGPVAVDTMDARDARSGFMPQASPAEPPRRTVDSIAPPTVTVLASRSPEVVFSLPRVALGLAVPQPVGAGLLTLDAADLPRERTTIAGIEALLAEPSRPSSEPVVVLPRTFVAVSFPVQFLQVSEKRALPGLGPTFLASTDDRSDQRRGIPAIDALLMANYREEIRALSAAGNRDALAAKALHLLTVLSSADGQRYAFEVLMDASGQGPNGGSLRQTVASFLRHFAEGSDSRRRALLFAAHWCYEREDYTSAVETAGKLKAETGDGDELQAEILMIEALCQIRLNQDRQALTTLGAIVKTWGKTTAAPKAQFMIGWIHVFSQENAEARVALQQVVRDYPNTDFATRAKRLLDGL